MDANDAVKLMNKFDKMLDCTYPPDDLGKVIGFDKVCNSSVSVSLSAGDGEDGFMFQFTTHTAYEGTEEDWLNPEHPVIQKYYNEMKEK